MIENKNKIYVGLMFIGIVAIISAIVNILTNGEGTICIINNITGLPCPSCGLTRSMLYALKFQFKEAFFYHPLFWLTPIAMLILGYATIKEDKILFSRTVIVVGVIAITVWAIRMFMFYPDVEPMVYRTGSLFGRIISFIN